MFIIAMLDLRKRYRLDLSEYDDAHIDAFIQNRYRYLFLLTMKK